MHPAATVPPSLDDVWNATVAGLFDREPIERNDEAGARVAQVLLELTQAAAEELREHPFDGFAVGGKPWTQLAA